MPAEEFENGILPVQHLEQAIHDGVIAADHPVEEGQLQPASLDLRLGREAWRVQASFLPESGCPLLWLPDTRNNRKIFLCLARCTNWIYG